MAPQLPGGPGRTYIRSLELALWVHRIEDRSVITSGAQTEEVLSTIPRDLPGLRKLYMAFVRGDLRPLQGAYAANKRFLSAEQDIFAPVDRMALEMFEAGLEELEIGVSTSIFHGTLMTGMQAGRRFQLPSWKPKLNRIAPGSYHSRQRIWRPIPRGEGHDDGEERGYWISETENDMPFGWMVNMSRYYEHPYETGEVVRNSCF